MMMVSIMMIMMVMIMMVIYFKKGFTYNAEKCQVRATFDATSAAMLHTDGTGAANTWHRLGFTI